MSWGDYLISFLKEARNSVLIAAPFIRSAALSRLLESIPESVDTRIITRWRPADVLSGASDLGVYDIAEARSIPLLLRNDLHAKLFITDDQCIVGSANVTETALGWRQPPNLELLVRVDPFSSGIETFVEKLIAGSVRATRTHQHHLTKLVEQLSSSSFMRSKQLTRGEPKSSALPPNWVPRTMNPEELYDVYSLGHEADVSRTTLSRMLDEVAQFGVVPNLSEPDFIAWIASSIIQTPLVQGVLDRIDREGSVSEAALVQLFNNIEIEEDNSPHAVLRTLQRWLTYFLADSYETKPESLRLIRAKRI